MITKSEFKQAWWLPGPHLQTIWPQIKSRSVTIPLRRERLELPDADFIDIDWSGRPGNPIALILHGLGGSIDSHYAKPLIKTLTLAGWNTAFMHFRGASGTPNRLPRLYHGGDTHDLSYVVSMITAQFPGVPICVIGVSLGGNVLLKWLGETQAGNPLTAAVAVSVPFDLGLAAARFEKGFSKFYQWWLVRQMKHAISTKFTDQAVPDNIILDAKVSSFREFDNHFTAPLHGFTDATDYYTQSSSRPYLNKIAVPTLIIHSLDDPFMKPEIIPETHELSSFIQLELSEHGGHVGFVGGESPLNAEYWIETRIPNYLNQHVMTIPERHFFKEQV